jgi:hypothetical protein
MTTHRVTHHCLSHRPSEHHSDNQGISIEVENMQNFIETKK